MLQRLHICYSPVYQAGTGICHTEQRQKHVVIDGELLVSFPDQIRSAGELGAGNRNICLQVGFDQ